MTTTVVPVPGGSLHVVDEGSREHSPIVLLHAGIADLRSWDEMGPSLADAGYRVVRYDERGFGASTTEDVEFSERTDAIAVIDALGIARAALVGNSRGGRIALDTAIEFPDRVVAVVGVAAGLTGSMARTPPRRSPCSNRWRRSRTPRSETRTTSPTSTCGCGSTVRASPRLAYRP